MIITVNNNESSSFIYKKNAEPFLEVQRLFIFFTDHY